jgi:Fur family transcriptional regulator, ferric uptake regulator
VKHESCSSKCDDVTPSRSDRLTRHQQAVLDLLREQGYPLSAQALYIQLRSRQAIGLATVYRALDALKLRGTVQSRSSTQGELLYSPVAQDQHFMTCLQCGQSFPVDHCPVHEAKTPETSVPFKIYYHTLEFFGLCEPCDQARH